MFIGWEQNNGTERNGETNVSDLDFDCRVCFILIFAKYSREIYLINLIYLILSRECKISVQIKKILFCHGSFIPFISAIMITHHTHTHTHPHTQNYKITICHHINRYQLLFVLFSASFISFLLLDLFLPVSTSVFSPFNIISTPVLLLHNVLHLIIIRIYVWYIAACYFRVLVMS